MFSSDNEKLCNQSESYERIVSQSQSSNETCDQSEHVYPIQHSGSMSVSHGYFEDSAQYSLFDDIQDLLDNAGNWSDPTDQHMEKEEDMPTLFVTKNNTEDVNKVDETSNPNVMKLVDEVFYDVRRKENEKHFEIPFDIGYSKDRMKYFKMDESVKQRNVKAHIDSVENISPCNKASELNPQNRPTVIVFDKLKRTESPNPVDFCPICGAPAGKHRYYGGRSCEPCRAFFRRSVQSRYFEIFHCKSEGNCIVKKDSRKKCQFCRFQKCLGAGMKTVWVLADEERNLRYNKLTKIKKPNPKPQAMAIPEVEMKFTIEEEKLMQDLHEKFKVHQQVWLKTLFLQDTAAGLNILEAMCRIAPLKMKNFKYLEEIFHQIFTGNIVPKLLENDDFPTKDVGQIIHGQNSAISHMFKMHQFTKMENTEKDQTPGSDCLQKQVSDLVEDTEIDTTEYIADLFTRLRVDPRVTVPTYGELYPQHWARDREVEDRHKDITRRLQAWPYDHNHKFDYNLVLIMSMILLFNPEYNPLVTRSIVANLQSKYVTLLHRYIRSKLDTEAANKKFLEAMLLPSVVREMWDLSRRHHQLTL